MHCKLCLCIIKLMVMVLLVQEGRHWARQLQKAGKPHEYLPDVVGRLSDGTPFIAEGGMEDDKRSDGNLAKAEAARRLSLIQRGTFWIGTEHRLSKHRLRPCFRMRGGNAAWPKEQDRRSFLLCKTVECLACNEGAEDCCVQD